MLGHFGMIPLTNYDFQWGRSEVVIIYPVIYWYTIGYSIGKFKYNRDPLSNSTWSSSPDSDIVIGWQRQSTCGQATKVLLFLAAVWRSLDGIRKDRRLKLHCLFLRVTTNPKRSSGCKMLFQKVMSLTARNSVPESQDMSGSQESSPGNPSSYWPSNGHGRSPNLIRWLSCCSKTFKNLAMLLSPKIWKCLAGLVNRSPPQNGKQYLIHQKTDLHPLIYHVRLDICPKSLLNSVCVMMVKLH